MLNIMHTHTLYKNVLFSCTKYVLFFFLVICCILHKKYTASLLVTPKTYTYITIYFFGKTFEHMYLNGNIYVLSTVFYMFLIL